MNSRFFYAMRLTFHPEPQVNFNERFPTRDEAQQLINATGKEGEVWIIVEEDEGNFTFRRGIVYPRQQFS